MASHHRLFSLVLFCVAIAVHAQQNVSGRWQGSFDIPGPNDAVQQHDSAFLILQQNGTQVTGGAGRNEQMQTPLSDGLFQSGTLTFAIAVRGTTVRFDLMLEGDHLRGTATGLPPDPTVKVAVDVARLPNSTIAALLEHFMGSILIVRHGQVPRLSAASVPQTLNGIFPTQHRRGFTSVRSRSSSPPRAFYCSRIRESCASMILSRSTSTIRPTPGRTSRCSICSPIPRAS